MLQHLLNSVMPHDFTQIILSISLSVSLSICPSHSLSQSQTLFLSCHAHSNTQSILYSFCLSLSLVTSISYFQVNSGFECGLALSSFTDFQDGDEVECMKVVWTVRTLSLQDGASGSLYDPVKDKKKNMISKNKKQSNNSY